MENQAREIGKMRKKAAIDNGKSGQESKRVKEKENGFWILRVDYGQTFCLLFCVGGKVENDYKIYGIFLRVAKVITMAKRIPQKVEGQMELFIFEIDSKAFATRYANYALYFKIQNWI